MNSKERVTACINRQRTDTVPLGFYLVDHDTISKVIGRPTYVRNNVALQIAMWEGRRDEVVESLKTDIVDFYKKIDLCDIITFKEAGHVPPKGYKPDPAKPVSEDHWQDSKGRVFMISKLSNEFICIKDPVAEAHEFTIEEFEAPVEDKPIDQTTLEVYDHVLKAFSGTRYIAGLTAGLGIFMTLGGMERGLMEFILRPELVKAAHNQRMAHLNLMDKYYLRTGIGGAFIERDMSSALGPLISPEMWLEFCFENMKSRIRNIKSLGPKQILMHSCGNTRKLLPYFIEAGVNVYQSIQTIEPMAIGGLKHDFGKQLVLWGGVPVEELVLGTPETIRKCVRKSMEAGAPGGGFILGPSHSIAFGTKYENFMAMLDEYDRLRFKF